MNLQIEILNRSNDKLKQSFLNEVKTLVSEFDSEIELIIIDEKFEVEENKWVYPIFYEANENGDIFEEFLFNIDLENFKISE